MQKDLFKVSQYVTKHPIIIEKETYKKRYISTLEYFVRKYSSDNEYSRSMLELFKSKLLDKPEQYGYDDKELKLISKGVLDVKIRKLKFFSYRYCLLVDVIFICAFWDKEKANEVFQEVISIYNKRYWKKLEILFEIITDQIDIEGSFEQTEYIVECVKKNKKFLKNQDENILVTANMSAGKSTLLNALIGKKVNKTQNDACTAKTHYLLNKCFEDGLTCEYDFVFEIDASREVLMEDNEKNEEKNIYVGTKYRTIGQIDKPICFIDTPGVNSSQDKLHREISQENITGESYEKLMYIMNAENIGTNDDRKHLEFVKEHFKGNVIFVVNKLDRYRKEDSIPDTLKQVKRDLEELGYENPIICPVSAYAAYLAKMNMFGEELNDDEMDELERFYRKLSKENYQLNKFYPIEYQDIQVEKDKNHELLLHSGILSLEKILYGVR